MKSKHRYALGVIYCVGIVLLYKWLKRQENFKKKSYIPRVKMTVETVSITNNHVDEIMNVLLRYEMKLKYKQLLIDTLATFDACLGRAGLAYMIYSGTLVGSVRHHDILRWDDDVDVLVPGSQSQRLHGLLTDTVGYGVTRVSSRWKFWNRRGTVDSKYSKWPYVDISFYAENETHIWDESDEKDMGGRNYVFSKEDTFPLTLRPLSTLLVRSPRRPVRHLYSTYGYFLHSCWSPTYRHQTEVSRDDVLQFECEELAGRVSFVHRVRTANGCKEILKSPNGTIENEYIVTNNPPHCDDINPYSLEIIH